MGLREADLFPWEAEHKKRKPERGDSIPPRTSLKAKVHSKPKIPGQEYLDLYMMVKEKDRLEKYGKTMGRNQKETAVAWRDIRGEIVKAKRNMPDPLPPTDEGATDQPQEEKKTFKIPAHLKRQSWDY